jgi:hypothetical protein
VSDIFRFWANVRPQDHIHPDDRAVLSRVQHGFDLRCLPACFGGPLRTAKVVLLYLSPRWSEQDRPDARSKEGRAYYARRRAGHEPFRGPEAEGFKWLVSRTAVRCEAPRGSVSPRLNPIACLHARDGGFSGWGESWMTEEDDAPNRDHRTTRRQSR